MKKKKNKKNIDKNNIVQYPVADNNQQEQQQIEVKRPEGITVVSPLYGSRKIVDRMVFSVLHQFVSKDSPYKINLVLVSDYIEKPDEYDYYISDEFKQFYDTDFIEITLIKNEEHKYQGESREIGFLAGKYDYFLLVDCDDMIAPNACDRYLDIIYKSCVDQNTDKIACVYGYLYGFDTNGYEQKIVGESIWVQSRCYNREFIKKHGIHFPTGTNSRQGEDYPFMRKFDYALAHDKEYIATRVPYNNNEDCQATAFWFPNKESLSRRDPYYSQHLAGWTMASSNSILDFFDNYNKEHGFEDEEDEYMKHEYLNMCIYSFYNLLDFIKTVSMTDYNPVEEDWYALRDNVAKLRSRLKEKYWDEIVFSDVEDMLFNVKHHSDCHFTEPWFGTFYDYIEKDVLVDENGTNIFDMDYDTMMKFAKTLIFDSAGHEIHSKQVVAWANRHNQDLKEMEDGIKKAREEMLKAKAEEEANKDNQEIIDDKDDTTHEPIESENKE